ncbi:cytosine deaminase [Opitutia bacterium ISCC 51]|nr:cytosine deaminase [Opitutae bacterium ISCC 51]QXD30150.1 cytosine deaminase [Opitutae bacterium ISCC 52]
MTDSIKSISARVPRRLLDSGYTGEADWEGLTDCVVRIENGLVRSVEAGQGQADLELNHTILLPGFLDAHTHLDKAHSWERAPNKSGTFNEALHNIEADKVNWTADDVYRRASYALRCAYAYGTVALRSHVDTGLPWARRSYEALSRLREEWAGRLELQLVSLASIPEYSESSGDTLADLPVEFGAIALGGMPLMNPDLDAQLDRLMALAVERSVGLDLHVDENNGEDTYVLEAVARAVLRNEFPNTVVCGHCCSLSVKPLKEQLEILELVKESGIKVVSLPMCNLYLQDRRVEEDDIQTPYWRGITLAHEFMNRGVPFACASDNVRDSFYAYGDLDMLEVYRESLRIGHLDRRLQESIEVVTRAPADLMGLSESGYGQIVPGAPAAFSIFHTSTMSQLLSRPLVRRQLFRDSKLEEMNIPDYSEVI